MEEIKLTKDEIAVSDAFTGFRTSLDCLEYVKRLCDQTNDKDWLYTTRAAVVLLDDSIEQLRGAYQVLNGGGRA